MVIVKEETVVEVIEAEEVVVKDVASVVVVI